MVWAQVVEPSPKLFEAGRVLHWALQVPAAFAATFLVPQEDDSHMNFRWRAALGALSSDACSDGYRVGLRFHDLTLLLFKDEALHSKYPLTGKTLEQGYTWLSTKLATPTLTRPDYQLPPHVVASGSPFQANELYKEIAKWYADAATVLEEMRVLYESTLPVRCWPRHFDMATRLELDVPGEVPGETRSLGVGMTPGDAQISEPYWYVQPRPLPATTGSPPLDDSRWLAAGWTGAVLKASDLTNRSADAQALQVEDFFKSTVAAARKLLEPPD